MIPLVMRLRVHDLGQDCCLQSPLSWNDLQNLVNGNIFLVAFNNKIVVQETPFSWQDVQKLVNKISFLWHIITRLLFKKHCFLEQIYLIHVQHQRHTTWGQHHHNGGMNTEVMPITYHILHPHQDHPISSHWNQEGIKHMIILWPTPSVEATMDWMHAQQQWINDEDCQPSTWHILFHKTSQKLVTFQRIMWLFGRKLFNWNQENVLFSQKMVQLYFYAMHHHFNHLLLATTFHGHTID